MSNSQEQSLDENAVFLPVNESSPEFLHCEKERQAVERLLNAGPEAFYSSIGTERSACFLSSEEVNQISSWAQDYRVNPLHVPREVNGEEGSSEVEAFSSTYIPAFSDTPAPDLELGWPEKSPWVPKASVSVHTSPPAEGEVPVREIIRRHLQKAKQVIAIVTDRLTDGAIIDDLHTAASRGVPVYIILNQRSIQENFTLNRLRHPNMQVRVLGGKNFCSRTGRMVVGEMKDKFLLVDLETVINGSYSLTWTDAHLHRQLITVLHGPVVDSFDREFRILFAASFPILDTWRVDVTHVDTVQQLKDFSNLRFQKHLPSEPEITTPPSPPAGSLLDWEAMGVIQRDGCLLNNPFNLHEEIVAKEMKQQNNMLFNKNAPIMDGFSNNGNLFVERTRLRENTSPVTNNLPERSKSFNYPRASPADLTTPERRKSKEYILEKALSRQLSIEKSPYVNDKTTAILEDIVTEPAYNKFTHSSTERIEHIRREPILEEGSSSKETSSKVENTPSSRKPLILRMPQSESFNSVSDLINRLQSQQDTSGRLKRGSNAVLSEESQFRRDLNAHNTETGRDERRVTLPRLKASGLETDVTPTQALMKKRNDDLKPLLYRLPRTFVPMERPRSSSFVDWRRSLAELEAQQE